jgi:hypothetical protein
LIDGAGSAKVVRGQGPPNHAADCLWIAIALLTAPSIGLYYGALAVWCTLPVLALTYIYCLSNRRRDTAILAVVATGLAITIIGFAMVFPTGSAA